MFCSVSVSVSVSVSLSVCVVLLHGDASSADDNRRASARTLECCECAVSTCKLHSHLDPPQRESPTNVLELDRLDSARESSFSVSLQLCRSIIVRKKPRLEDPASRPCRCHPRVCRRVFRQRDGQEHRYPSKERWQVREPHLS